MLGIPRGILEIHADGTGLNDRAGGMRRVLGPVPITRFNIGCHWDCQRTCDSRHCREHFFLWNLLPIGIAERKGNSGTGCSDRGKTTLFDCACAGNVPHVGQQQRF